MHINTNLRVSSRRRYDKKEIAVTVLLFNAQRDVQKSLHDLMSEFYDVICAYILVSECPSLDEYLHCPRALEPDLSLMYSYRIVLYPHNSTPTLGLEMQVY